MANRNTRNRTVLLAPSDDGIQCDVLEENRLCLSLIDTSQDTTPSCELSEWGSCDAAYALTDNRLSVFFLMIFSVAMALE